ncbi:hypothetical protein GTY80_05300, partial [Amycolatopsis sp. SID8362]|nr:hypothetical protein [Amycolatopsis sp. SID8362]
MADAVAHGGALLRSGDVHPSLRAGATRTPSATCTPVASRPYSLCLPITRGAMYPTVAEALALPVLRQGRPHVVAGAAGL